MDDRRRTISSGDAMIGEALMRISNTMEAERLTKSLDYQEKLRSRSNIRLIIGIICIFIAFMMLLMSGGLLFVFIKYQDPILDAWVPLVRSIINGLNVAIQASIMKSTYGVIQKRIMVEGNIALLQLLKNINNIDINGLLSTIGGVIGTVSGTISDVGVRVSNAIAELSGNVTGVISGLGNGEALAAAMTTLLKDTGLDTNAIAGIINNVASTVGNLTGAASTVTSTATTAANEAANLSIPVADLLGGLTVGKGGSADLLSAGIGIMNKLASALCGLAGIFG